MKHTRNPYRSLLAGLSLVVCAATPALAQEGEGVILLGYRSVDVDGSQAEFDEDINQDDGPVLFRLDISVDPESGLADHLELDATDLGGQSFESLHFGARSYGVYEFTFDRRESDYSYHDTLGAADGTAHPDYHTFDFRRVRDVARLELDLAPTATLTFGFDRFSKSGESTTTLDISRDEFEFHRPVDEEMESFDVGFSYAWDKVTLVLEERISDYQNMVEVFLPGASEGEAPGPATLDFFFLDQPYDYSSQRHTARVLARPHEKLDLRFSASLESLDLDLEASEHSQGTTFSGSPFTTDLGGEGQIDRDIELYDFELTYLVNERLGVVAGARHKALDQRGGLAFGTDFNASNWELESTGYEAGVRFRLPRDFSLGGGLAFETRDIAFHWEQGSEGHGEDGSTDSSGYWLDLAWRPDRSLELIAKIDTNSFDDPFTLTSPTDRSRYRLQGRYRWENGLSLQASVLRSDFENDDSGWTSDTLRSTVRLGYTRPDLVASFGYSNVEMDREIAHVVAGGALRPFFDIDYGSDSDFFDGRVRWSPTERLAVGGNVYFYDNAGSFALQREDLRAFVECAFTDHYVGGISYRRVDYDEGLFDFDDYSADIVELTVGYRH